MIPVTIRFDQSRVVGHLQADGLMEFPPYTVTDEMLPMGFGYQIEAQEFRDGIRYLNRIRLREISLGVSN